LSKFKIYVPVNRPSIGKEEKALVNECLDSGWIGSEGSYVKKFENKFKKIVNRKFAISVANGTAAIDIAIRALNIKKNDEVIVPNFTIISCVNELVRVGAKPVFIDADIDTWNMKVSDIEKKITSKTKAIIVSHIYGLPTDLNLILKIAKKKKLKVIEDGAELLGQEYYKKPIGSFGDISTFSFYVNKHITTGEGGMLVTNSKSIADRASKLRNICFNPKKQRFIHDEIGWNYRLSNIQSAIGFAQLFKLKRFIKKKREIGKFYNNEFKNIKSLKLPKEKTKYSKNIYWVYGILLKNKTLANEFAKQLKKYGIQTRPFFCPMHLQPILKKNGIIDKKDKFPVSEYIFKRGLYIPSGIGTTNEELKYVSKIIRKICP